MQHRFTPTSRTTLNDLVANIPPPGAERDWYFSKLSPNQRRMVIKALEATDDPGRTGGGRPGGPPDKVQGNAKGTAQEGQELKNSQDARAWYLQQAQETGRTQPLSSEQLFRFGPQPGPGWERDIGPDGEMRGWKQTVKPEDTRPPADSAGRGDWAPPQPPPQPPPPGTGTGYQPYTGAPVQIQSVTPYQAQGWNPNTGLPGAPQLNYQNRDYQEIRPQGGLTQQQGMQRAALQAQQAQPVSIQRTPAPNWFMADQRGNQATVNAASVQPAVAPQFQFRSGTELYNTARGGIAAYPNGLPGPPPGNQDAANALRAKYGVGPATTAPNFLPATGDWRRAMGPMPPKPR